MRNEAVDAFYGTKAWKDCRAAYRKAHGGLCEFCWKKGEVNAGTEVHHLTHITAENVHDPNVTLNFDNLVLLCKECHDKEHGKRKQRTDEYGFVQL